MRTIRRNSKEFRTALETATEVHRRTLATNWKPVPSSVEEVTRLLEDRAYKFQQNDAGKYIVTHAELPVEYTLIHDAPAAAPGADDSDKD
ncbi:hypothetical protein OG225_43260 (plasmid) [Nocardia sp. NBC_01377]|uniref:hypothetical protein n=1 Tax=Nocardia sp. NBC_01377 TaxID=2903595 RepID=UPI002F910F4F